MALPKFRAGETAYIISRGCAVSFDEQVYVLMVSGSRNPGRWQYRVAPRPGPCSHESHWVDENSLSRFRPRQAGHAAQA
jgi:hypothetical protein